MFKGAQIGRSMILSALGLSLASAALAAESQASTMAGRSSGSSAQMGAVTAAGGLSASESTTENGNSSSSERSSTAAAQNSSMMTPLPPRNSTELNVKNLPANGGSPLRGSANGLFGSQPVRAVTGGGNDLIQNSVKPYNDDAGKTPVVTSTTTTINRASSVRSAPANATAARVPHARVQFWNRTTTRHR
ncbi:MAG: hypothetical protein KGS72_16030 [Cyanobacteria bacterium REEB67]|nr:hypothetical protein [Cyanobacteria bacterium REEB67]